VLDPALLQRDGVIDVIRVNIRVEKLRAVRSDAVSASLAIRKDVWICGLLRSLYGDRKTAAPGGRFVHPRNNWNGKKRSGIRSGLVSGDHGVG
jgi:hypothetical protein